MGTLQRSRRGFTLIELLVVIAIIAILAAILFPVFAQAREAARTSACLSNEKQVSLAVLQYCQDYDEYFPQPLYCFQNGAFDSGNCPIYKRPDAPWGPWSAKYMGWNHAVQPYVKNHQVFKCPSRPDGPDYSSNNGSNEEGWRTGEQNYWINKSVSGDPFYGAWGSSLGSAKQASLSWSAVTIMIGEGPSGCQTGAHMHRYDGWGYTDGYLNLANGSNSGDPWTDNSGTAQGAYQLCSTKNGNKANMNDRSNSGPDWGNPAQPPPARVHRNGANWVFTDGHAKWYAADYMCVVYDVSRNHTGQTPTFDKGGSRDF